jgi:cytochrome c biogenesis protein CcdA
MYIARQSTSMRAFLYLILYNAFFIVPLLVVFFGVYYGSQSKALVNFGRKNILFSKLALGSLFIVLSVLLWQSALS